MSDCSRRQFLAGGALAALGGTLALAGGAPMSHEEATAKRREAAAGKDKNADGEVTAIGTGMGKHGEFTVEVSAKDGAIDRITVLDSRETPGMGDVAMEKMTQAIIDNQTLAVDTISGAGFAAAITAANEGKSIVLIDNTKAVELVTDDAGAVVGVKVENPVTGDTSEVKCKAVVLATGGFGSNIDMRVKYNPDMDGKILSTDSVAAQDDGIVMAEKIGADTIDMEYIQTYPVCDPETGALLYVGDVRLENHGILVNREGDRFVQELDRRDVISNGIKNQTDGVAFLLFDQAAAGEVAGHKMGTNRLGSCSMTDIYTFGRIAGKNAATYAA